MIPNDKNRQSSDAQDEADEANPSEDNHSKPDAQASISGSETDKRNEEVSSSSTRENDESQPETKDTKDKSASRGRPISKKLKIGDSECDSSESKDYRSISPPSLISEGLTDSSSSDIESVLQVKITLKNITPKVWRRLLVNSNFTFEDLNFMEGGVQQE
ncbi:hypothetical protein MTP99_013401 [Tenebrio molitor]|nr:hypothetical protein MTP99_013401 [Tenebrio molitor]